MNREILFKAKIKDDGEWVEGYYQKRFDLDGSEQHFIFWSKSYTVWEYVEIDSDTLCQYTGLTDKNGRKIWENDIVVEKYKGRIAVKYRIVFDLEEGSWMLETRSGARYGIGSINQKDFEVIGNIFDNDLLEVE